MERNFKRCALSVTLLDKAFTLLELIIVIIIVGILAVVGLNQYTRMAERGRLAEAFATMSKIRKDIVTYYLQNGTLATITDAAIGIGIEPGLPYPSCVSTHYFIYHLAYPADTTVDIYCYRCTSGGKAPQSPYGQYAPHIRVTVDGSMTSSGCYDWGSGYGGTWCTPK